MQLPKIIRSDVFFVCVGTSKAAKSVWEKRRGIWEILRVEERQCGSANVCLLLPEEQDGVAEVPPDFAYLL